MGAISEAEERLVELWRQAVTGDEAVARTCSLNLVVACDPGDDLREISETAADLAVEFPNRALVILAGAGEAAGLRLEPSLRCRRAAGARSVCSEQVVIHASSGSEGLVPATVLQLLCPELPVATWWRRSLEQDALLRDLAELSNRWIMDSAERPDPVEALGGAAALGAAERPGANLADLAWSGLEPWRETVAALFDPPEARDDLQRIARVEVSAGGPAASSGLTVAGAYLVGWLASRLGWRVDGAGCRRGDGAPVKIELAHDPRAAAGRPVSVRIEARRGKRRSLYSACCVEGKPGVVRGAAEMECACPLPFARRLPESGTAALLCREMERSGPDPVFQTALREAARLAVGFKGTSG